MALSTAAAADNAEHMQTVRGIDQNAVRDLFHLPAPVTSAYFGLGVRSPQDDPNLRWNALADRLLRAGADPQTVGAMGQAALDAVPGSGVCAVFGSAGDVRLTIDLPDAGSPDRASHGAVPLVLPFLAWLQDHPPYVVAAVDRTGADIEVRPQGVLHGSFVSISGPDDEIERNAPGGWSQGRYQRRAEDSWKHNAAAVAEQVAQMLKDLDAHLLLVAGDVRAVQFFTDQLPAWVRHEVTVRHLSGGRGADGSALKRSEQVAREVRLASDAAAQALLARLTEERHPHGHGVLGIRATVDALARGQVETLLVVDDPADSRSAWFGPRPTAIGVRRGALPGVLAWHGRLADVAVRSALLTNANIRVLSPEPAAAVVDGVAALCRFA